jgi:hypothetical protein
MAPLMLRVSPIWLLISELRSIACRRISRSIRATRLAGSRKSGRTTIDSKVSRHSNASITASVDTSVITLVTTFGIVPVIALCAPTTSLFSREMISPLFVWVKNRIDIF